MMKFKDFIADDRLTLKPFSVLLDYIKSNYASALGRLVGCTMLPSNAIVYVGGLHKLDNDTCDIVVFVNHMNKEGVYIIRHDLSLDVILQPMADEIVSMGDSIYRYEDSKGVYVLVCDFNNPSDSHKYEVDDCMVISVLDSQDNCKKDLNIFRLRGKYVIGIISNKTKSVMSASVLTDDDMLVLCQSLLRYYIEVSNKHGNRDLSVIEAIDALKGVLRDLKSR